MPSHRPFPPYSQRLLHEDRRRAETHEKSRGRLETRILTTTTLANTHLSWPGVKQALRLERITVRDGKSTHTVSYAITSVDRQRASTADLLTWYRGRWKVENTAFWVRDMTLGEDLCRIRSGTAPDAFSRIRNAAINTIKALGETNVAATLRKFAFRNDLIFTTLGIINH